ncbi:MAG: hypothetical protein R3C42_01045 [Parvularculaceae bacterium]
MTNAKPHAAARRAGAIIAGAAMAGMALAGAVAANDTYSAPDFDRASFMRQAAERGFGAAEEARLTLAGEGDADAIIDLGRFYMAHELWIEALAAFDRLETEDAPRTLTLKAECAYRMGRYAAVADMLAESARAEPLRAMALSRLGAYLDAAALFAETRIDDTPQNLRRDYQLAAAEAFAQTGESVAANAALEGAGDFAGGDARLDFLVAKIRKSEGQASRENAALRRAGAEGTGEWAMRARLAIAAAAGDAQEIELLALQYRGGAFEREKRLALGEIRLAGRDFDRGFSALSGLVDRYPRSDAALTAQEMIAANLPRLFAADAQLNPKDAARLFFENVDFAPPGAEGDALIRNVSQRLVALGLYRQAGDLLEHQTFKRLRGAGRARRRRSCANIACGERSERSAARHTRDADRRARRDAHTKAQATRSARARGDGRDRGGADGPGRRGGAG